MAKRGQFYPYRIKYRYTEPDISGTLVLMTPADVGREGKGLLRRGATIEVFTVDYPTQARKLVATMTPADLPDDDGMEE